MRILGIDPGFARIGIGIVDKVNEKISLVHVGMIETEKEALWSRRLIEISNEIQEIIEIYKPEIVHIERQFFFRNVNNVFKIAEARGVILLEVYRHNLEVIEFTPLQMKCFVTGDGRAKKPAIFSGIIEKLTGLTQGELSKKEFSAIVAAKLKLEKAPLDDACDAIGFALMEVKSAIKTEKKQKNLKQL